MSNNIDFKEIKSVNVSSFVIYHNPSCSKSRQSLELLKEKGVELQVIEYLKRPLTEEEILDIINKFSEDPKLLVRTKEALFKEHTPDIDSNAQIAKAIVKFPKLLERPIVVVENKAVLGRPPENILNLLK